MKKFVCVFLVLFVAAALTGCGTGSTDTDAAPSSDGAVDVDLTMFSGTMLYSEVYNMQCSKDDYIGKTVRMRGQFALYRAVDENGNTVPDQYYFACVAADSTACCQQGLEFVLEGDAKYPEDYPELGSQITVTGEFQTYYEDETRYCHLVHASLV